MAQNLGAEAMSELKALRAVAEAARELLTDARVTRINVMDAAKTDGRWHGCADAMQLRIQAAAAALDALDALPAPPPYETVGYLRRVLLYHGIGIGKETVWRATVEALPGKTGYFLDPEHWRHFATMTGPVSQPVVPVIAATVTREPGA